jgi:Alternate to MurJ
VSIELLLGDHRLLLVVVIAGVVSMLTTLNVAARPAAVSTGRVAVAFTLLSLAFMVTRLANLFYLPFLNTCVDRAAHAVGPDHRPTAEALLRLYHQIQLVVVGCAGGGLVAFLALPTFIEVFRRGITSMVYRQSMMRVLLRLTTPRGMLTLLTSVRPPSLLGVRLLRLGGVPADFLLINVAATAIWTVGALCATLASAREAEYAATALLLSGLINSFAAIAFSVWVDPKAALITDQVVLGERPPEQVNITAVHLSLGNFVGAALGLLLLEPGTQVICAAAQAIGKAGGNLGDNIWLFVAINAGVTLLASTSHISRISAVLTRRVASAMAVYNLFSLVTRLATQVYAPVLGSLRDRAVALKMQGDIHAIDQLGPQYRLLVAGATLGTCLGFVLMPTFVEIYKLAVRGLDRCGSMPALLLEALKPARLLQLLGCLRRPTLFGVRWRHLAELPQAFIWGNVVVISVYTIGMMAAIHAGAQLAGSYARTATQLSSVVNGVATIMLSLVVDPTTSLITDQCVGEQRPVQHIYAAAVFLVGSTIAGTLLSQVLFGPATSLVGFAARLLAHP